MTTVAAMTEIERSLEAAIERATAGLRAAQGAAGVPLTWTIPTMIDRIHALYAKLEGARKGEFPVSLWVRQTKSGVEVQIANRAFEAEGGYVTVFRSCFEETFHFRPEVGKTYRIEMVVRRVEEV